MRGRVAALALLCWTVQASSAPQPRQGRFNVVTYNVAGLPEGLSQVHPVANLPLIGAALNRYDLAFVQEDYAYPDLLRSRLRLAYQSPAFVRGEALHFGDGLSAFSKFELGDLRRVAWQKCHGVFDSYSDCLTPKGLAMTRVELAPGALVDTYNVHLDAGSGPGDLAARAAQLQQLFEAVTAWSGDAAVIVAGDFNLTRAELSALRSHAERGHLFDACEALRCGQPARLDRVLYRSGPALELRARSWRAETSLRDKKGQPLSDHLAVVVGFEWALPVKGKAVASNARTERRPDAH